jgi:hypothetical protein
VSEGESASFFAMVASSEKRLSEAAKKLNFKSSGNFNRYTKRISFALADILEGAAVSSIHL